jgi:hypothetical protein
LSISHTGRIYRCAAPITATASDQEFLLSSLGIRQLVRSKTLENHPWALESDTPLMVVPGGHTQIDLRDAEETGGAPAASVFAAATHYRHTHSIARRQVGSVEETASFPR